MNVVIDQASTLACVITLAQSVGHRRETRCLQHRLESIILDVLAQSTVDHVVTCSHSVIMPPPLIGGGIKR